MVQLCALTTKELAARMQAHRNMAKLQPGYNLDPKKTQIDLGYSTTQEVLSSVYRELIAWRAEYGMEQEIKLQGEREEWRDRIEEVPSVD